MKASDYIVSFLINKKISDVFGYPGGMVTHLMDSFDKYSKYITAHVNYHEQASAFCACSFAQVSKNPGVAYATSGPGATNLITGIANAYFDSIPCIFITGQVNTYETKCDLKVRQKGFQETDIVSIVNPIVKYAKMISNPEDLKYELEKAFYLSMEGRPGPVLLDIPMDVQRANIEVDKLEGFEPKQTENESCLEEIDRIINAISCSKKPVILAGAGIDIADVVESFRKMVDLVSIPVVSSMIGIDVLPTNHRLNYGFIGAYGHRYANFIIAKCDLIITIGSRVDCRQTGSNMKNFAKHAKILRIDIDAGEVTNQIKINEDIILANLKILIPAMAKDTRFNLGSKFLQWEKQCISLKSKLSNIDNEFPNKLVEKISEMIPDGLVVTTDVGQNQVWVAQSFKVKPAQRILFTGGHGAMGYSLPAAIGAYYASGRPVICFSGDGGLQMNIQELQFIVREHIPIKIILFNNQSLGMIRHFQEMYFDSNFMQTCAGKGYTVPDFSNIATAYGIEYIGVTSINQIELMRDKMMTKFPVFVEIKLEGPTYVYPKLSMGRELHDQDPLMDRDLFEELLSNQEDPINYINGLKP